MCLGDESFMRERLWGKKERTRQLAKDKSRFFNRAWKHHERAAAERKFIGEWVLKWVFTPDNILPRERAGI